MDATKTFTGKLNLDAAIEYIPDGDYTYMLNGVIGTSKDGKRGSFESMIGTSELEGIAQMSGGICIGGCRDNESDDHYLFFRNNDPAKNCIVKVNNNTVTRVMVWSGLNFQSGIDYRIQSVFINGYLYFTDNYNPPRGFSVYNSDGSIRYASSSPSSEQDISLIKRGPIYAQTFTKMTDSSVSLNLIAQYDFQFTYQYIYNDGQQSVVAPYSILCSRKKNTETLSSAPNKVRVSIPNTESIPSDVKEIKFAVRIGNNSGFQYIGTLYRSTDNFTTKYIDFFNTVYGGSVGTDYLNTSHDIPIKSRCLEFIKNRLWLGNITDGYPVPSSPPLTVTTEAQLAASVGDEIIQENVTFTYVNRYDYTVSNAGSGLIQVTNSNVEYGIAVLKDAVLENDLRSVNGKEVTLISGTLGSPLSKYEITNPNYDQNGTIPLQFIGMGIVPFGSNTSVTTSGSTPPTSYVAYRLGNSFTATLKVGVVTEESINIYSGSRTFPNGSQYKVGLIYKDKFGRASSVVPATGDITTASNSYSNLITASWTLPSGTNLDIPSWADSYHIVRTRNITKSSFFEWRTVAIHYYDASNNLHSTYTADRKGIKIDITPMTNIGLGYSYESGDRIVLYKPNGTDTFNIPIKEYTAGIIITDNINIGTISDETVNFEIYKPNLTTEDLIYYEVGIGYSITNAGTQTRSFSTTTGYINGDSFNVILDTYTKSGSSYSTGVKTLFKEMSNDITDVSWNTDIGKPNIISSIGQVQRPYTFKHSSLIINDTEVNGLSEFYAADQALIPFECGEIFRLKSSSRVASDGTVLLAICRNKPVSIYVDESRLNINNDVSYIVNGSQVIGEINALNGSYGTVHPDSVIDDGRFVYWYSHIRRSFVRYGTNGVFPVSEYSVVNYFEKQALLNNESSLVIGGYFPFYDIVLVSFQNAESSDNRTISYMDKDTAWRSFLSFTGDYFFDAGNRFYSVKNGVVHVHNNESAYCCFHGQNQYSKISVPINIFPDTPKIWQTVQLHLSQNFIIWSNGDQIINKSDGAEITVLIENNNGQSSNIIDSEFDISEYVAYAPIKYDTNSAGGISSGDDMVSRTATITVYHFSPSRRNIHLLKVGFIPSMGHTL